VIKQQLAEQFSLMGLAFLDETIESLEENHPKKVPLALNNFAYQGSFITHLK